MTRNNITNENWMDELDKVFKEANLKWGQEALISPTIHEIISQEKKALLDSVMEEVRIFNINAGNRSISEWKIEGIINNLRKDI